MVSPHLHNKLDDEAVASGGAAHPDLVKEVVRIGNSPLAEDYGEGFHRATHNTKRRSDGSRKPWILSAVRRSQSLTICRNFIERNGNEGGGESVSTRLD